MLTKSSSKSLVGKPDETMPIRCQLWRLRMRLFAIEHFADCLALLRRQSCNEDERSNSFVDARPYHSTRISVRNKDHRAIGLLKRTFKCSDII
jgi:hypothetical protein